MKQSINILAIDPSMRNFGYAACQYNLSTHKLTVRSVGVMQTKALTKKAKKHTKANMALSADSIKVFNSFVPFMPYVDVIIAEMPFAGTTNSATISYAMCVTLVSLLAEVHNKPLVPVSPHAVKRHVRPYEKDYVPPSKEEIIDWVLSEHPYVVDMMPKAKSRWEHICDATVAAHVGINEPLFKQHIQGLSP